MIQVRTGTKMLEFCYGCGKHISSGTVAYNAIGEDMSILPNNKVRCHTCGGRMAAIYWAPAAKPKVF